MAALPPTQRVTSGTVVSGHYHTLAAVSTFLLSALDRCRLFRCSSARFGPDRRLCPVPPGARWRGKGGGAPKQRPLLGFVCSCL
jgi:hypothetical protein